MAGCVGSAAPSIQQMDMETEQDPQEPPVDPSATPADEEEGPEYNEDNPPSATDFLTAAKEGAKNLKQLEP